MFRVLFRNDGKVADLISVVGLQVSQRFLEISGHFSRRRCARDGASRRLGRHDGFTRKTETVDDADILSMVQPRDKNLSSSAEK